MPGSMRSGDLRKVGAVVAVVGIALALAVGLSSVASAVPAGPRLAFLEVQYPAGKESAPTKAEVRKLTIRFASVGPEGQGRKPLFATPGVIPGSLGSLSWSADGEEVAFIGSAKKNGAPLEAFVATAEGGHLRPVPATAGSISAVLSPDGKWIAFERSRKRVHHAPKPKKGQELSEEQFEERLTGPRVVYESTTTWIAPVAGGKARQLTKWQNWHSSVPSSWSPDGSHLLVTMAVRSRAETVDSVDLATGTVTTVEPDAAEAAFSPDGSKIAFTSYRDGESVPGFDEPEGTRELYVANADGSGAKRLTRTTEDESGPSWDPSGNRIGYLRTPGGMLAFLGIEGEVMEINADGTCPTTIAVPKPKAKGWTASVQPPVWRPGEGRGVEPLSCQAGAN
jgi:dipeptidyl aminopeptidase/acylaminoacyl peptidase